MTFKDALKTKEFVVTAHVNLPRAPDAELLIRQGEILRPAVDAVQLTDNPNAQVHMSGLAAAALLAQAVVAPGARIGLLISGGNVDLRRALTMFEGVGGSYIKL